MTNCSLYIGSTFPVSIHATWVQIKHLVLNANKQNETYKCIRALVAYIRRCS